MAYNLFYTLSFNNLQKEDVIISLYQKDVTPASVKTLTATQFSVNYLNGDGKKFDPIIAAEATIGLYIKTTDSVDFTNFVIDFHDQWKVIATVGTQRVFVGFLVPGDGITAFRDKPYEIILSATDGLGYLKDILLTNNSGVAITGVNHVIDYLSACLFKTNLDLNIRVYSNIYEETMQDRNDNPVKDNFNQSALHARSFLSDAITFYDCYTVLQRILGQHYSLYQWNGMWVINRVAEMQSSVGPRNWYTTYDNTGAAIGGTLETNTYCRVGKGLKIAPINADQNIGGEFAIKSAKHSFNYMVWPELPTNNKFERGTQFEQGVAKDEDDIDDDGDFTEIVGTYKKFTIDSWEYGKTDALPGSFPFVLSPPDGASYVKKIFNDFGVLLSQKVVIPEPSSDFHWLRSEGIPVKYGDKIAISGQKKFDYDFTAGAPSFTIFGYVYIAANDGVTFYGLSSPSSGGSIPEGLWKKNSLSQLTIDYAADQNSMKWASMSVNSLSIPVDGVMYIAFAVGDGSGLAMYTDFNLSYYPFVAGGYLQLKGDYWLTQQNGNYKDTVDEEVFVSDSFTKVLKGALWRDNLIDLTNFNWRRFGIAEQRHYKELVNLGRFNAAYRRQWKIDGSFGGVKFVPNSDVAISEPISFHRHFSFPNSSLLNGFYFMLVPPLKIDYWKAEFNGVFVDCYNSNSTIQHQTIKQIIFGLASLINSTSEAAWDGASLAPSHGTPGFPPHAGYSLFNTNTLVLSMNDADNATATADDNGAGNSPSITETSNTTGGGIRVIYYQIGTDIMAGNKFTITIYGVDITITVANENHIADGSQEGDIHSFGYNFS